MKPVAICGIGILSRCAQSVEELTLLCTGKEPELAAVGRLTFASHVPASKLRRCSHYMKLGVNVSGLAAEDGCISENMNPARIGTIFTTGYGAVESNIQFSDSVVKGNPDLCPPTAFLSSVPNSCVGQTCIVRGYRGVSTLLMGGDPLEYTTLLLETGKADCILCGAVEEYNRETADSIMTVPHAAGCEISEGAAALAVRRCEEVSDYYCKASGFSSASLPVYPYLHRVPAEHAVPVIRQTVLALCRETPPDAVFTTSNGTYFDQLEAAGLRDCLPASAAVCAPKRIFGETLGSGYLMSAALAAVCLKAGKLPPGIISICSQGKLESILVTGIDTSGNYCCMLLKK